MRVIRNALIAAAVLAALAGAGTALADPAGTPPLNSIVGLCGDAFVFNQLSTDYNATIPPPPQDMYCFNEVNPATGAVGGPITTKASGPADTTCRMTRPYGDAPSIVALEQNMMDGGVPCIDFVVSTRGPLPTDPTTIVFVAQVKDAATWSTPEATGVASPAPASLTPAQLAAIYTCADTNWDQVGGLNAPIVPVLPKDGSDTRDNFLRAIGVSAPGACVVNGANATGSIVENTGLGAANVAQFDPNGVPAVNDIFPYSIAAYIAQGPAINGTGGHATAAWGRGNLVLHEINGIQPISNPTTAPVINPAFPVAFWYILHVVVRNAGTAASPAIPAYLQRVFGPTGFTCTSAVAHADWVSYGYTTIGNLCGSL